jgi:hypothetical protein
MSCSRRRPSSRSCPSSGLRCHRSRLVSILPAVLHADDELVDYGKSKEALTAAEAQAADACAKPEEATAQLAELPKLTKTFSTAESSVFSPPPKLRGTLNARAEAKKAHTSLDAERLKSQKADERAQAAEMRTAEIPKLRETIAAREAECEERRRDVAALEYKFFELEKKEDALSPRCRGCERKLLRSRRVCVRLPEMGYMTDVLVQNFSTGRKSLMPTRARSKTLRAVCRRQRLSSLRCLR